jgi:ATP-dependent Clp protease ATP-binding subunit ClpX
MSVLCKPKNAITNQYKKLLDMDGVELCFEDDALRAIAKKALEKKTGARALRAIIEEYMLDIMYEIPKDPDIGRVIITSDYIEKKGGPVIQMRGC